MKVILTCLCVACLSAAPVMANESVTNWLAEHGFDRSRLTAKGYGEADPMASNSTDEGRGKNRRVELVRM